MPRQIDQSAEKMRHCVLGRESIEASSLIRLAVAPDGLLVPDLAEKLPGRGVWVSADAVLIRQSVDDGRLLKAVARSLKASPAHYSVPEDLALQIDELLSQRILHRIGLLRRSGAVVTGFEKVTAALARQATKPVALVFVANDAADDSVRKLRARLDGVPAKTPFSREALSQILGQENAVFVLIFADGGIDRLTADLRRLEGLRKRSFDLKDVHKAEAKEIVRSDNEAE